MVILINIKHSRLADIYISDDERDDNGDGGGVVIYLLLITFNYWIIIIIIIIGGVSVRTIICLTLSQLQHRESVSPD